MGSGSYAQHVEKRFHLGSRVEGKKCIGVQNSEIKEYEVGNYRIIESRDGFLVKKNDEKICLFKEGVINESERRALFRLDLGMQLEIMPNRHREIFSPEKATIHGAMCADGTLRCGGYLEKYRGKIGYHYKYDVRLCDENPIARSAFADNIRKVYGIEAHDYPRRKEVYAYGKKMAYDLMKYGPLGTYSWKVPFERLNKEGAQAWLRAYFTGDGGAYLGRVLTDSAVMAISVNRQGLDEVRNLLEDYFGIRSEVYPNNIKGAKIMSYKLEIDGYKDLKKFRDEIGFIVPEKQETLNEIIRKLEGH